MYFFIEQVHCFSIANLQLFYTQCLSLVVFQFLQKRQTHQNSPFQFCLQAAFLSYGQLLLTSSIRSAPQCLQSVQGVFVSGWKEILEKSNLTELIFCPVFLSAQIFRKFEVEIICIIVQLYSLIIKSQQNCSMEPSLNQQLKQMSFCSHVCSTSSNKKQYHCQKCKLWQEDHLIEEVKFAPEGYISNKRNKKDQQFERRINASLKEFMHKFSTKNHSDLVADMREKVIKIKKAEPYAKGGRECAAIVVYYAFQDQIRMSLREFCKQNNLNVKLFNKKYIAYNKLFRRDSPIKQVQFSSQHNYSNIKVQQRPEQYTALNLNDYQQKYQKEPFIKLYPEYPENINEKNICKNLQHLHKAIECVYDDIFRGYYFKSRKQSIVKKIADRINRIDSDLLKVHSFQEDQPINYFYLIFAVLKFLSFGICFSRFCQIVKNRAGYYLTKERATKARNMYKEMQEKRTDEGERDSDIELSFLGRSEKQKEWDRPMQQFQLVESGPIVLQEEYFSFQNCYFMRSGNSNQIN